MRKTLEILAAATVCIGFASPVFASPAVPGMGTNYFVYDLGTYDPDKPSGPGNNIYVPGDNFKTPVGQYQLMPGEVDKQIADMRASGMDYIVLNIAMDDLEPCKEDGKCSDGVPQDWSWGYLLDDSESGLRPTQRANLIAILQDIRRDGFRRVVIRFADGDVARWKSWNEAQYQLGWHLIESVHDLVGLQLAGSMTAPIYDLGMEVIGGGRPETKNYVRRLWSDYTNAFGTGDTVGFSTIADAYHLRALDWYGSKRPAMYAFDIYNNVGDGLARAWDALGSERSKPILIMETYPNDPIVADQIRSALSEHAGMNLIAVISWPSGRNIPICDGCTRTVSLSAVRALDGTAQISNLSGLASKVVVDNSSGNLLAVTDLDCASTSAPTCSIRIDEGYPPSGRQDAYEVYVTSPQLDNAWALVSCGNGSGHSNIDWIRRDISYEFESYRVSSCRDSVAGELPYATSVLSVR